ncbi:uncharacterized protein BT62DRAFT_1080260 [Guyanagaster necrorhizus]|uniref:Uncharacterized protein n=1 Tax=Guyanagaster necrorhizus TaxID=856835 RepID=A0A9P7VIP8_9AGAR|nr:uncharacterized protein BT62DRAFT_1080260 [Guyanagaster necrorhizus MCA 3950]KAG7441265.1 hypothetical protein BT62DRAFT_1080260 [Guyanagaster necrorhizus MCA 3950]
MLESEALAKSYKGSSPDPDNPIVWHKDAQLVFNERYIDADRAHFLDPFFVPMGQSLSPLDDAGPTRYPNGEGVANSDVCCLSCTSISSVFVVDSRECYPVPSSRKVGRSLSPCNSRLWLYMVGYDETRDLDDDNVPPIWTCSSTLGGWDTNVEIEVSISQCAEAVVSRREFCEAHMVQTLETADPRQ